MRIAHYFAIAITMVLLLANSRAAAGSCLPVKYYLYVGTDAKCNTSDIQTAINDAVCPATTIVVTNEKTYTNQHITIGTRAVNIEGSTSACNQPPVFCNAGGCGGGPPPTKIAISGDGTDPVFYVSTGGSLMFANLAISSGAGASNSLSGGGGIGIFGSATNVTLNNVELLNNSGGYGGGVAFYGDGSLTLDGVSIHANQAGFGGGVSAVSSFAGHVDLTIADDPHLFSSIYNNIANDQGGGIYVDGDVHLLAVTSNAQIQNNTAGEEGGGIAVGGGALADIGMAGQAIDSNKSNLYGGGIAVIPNTGGNAIVRLFSIVPGVPLTLSNNSALQAGGALYVYPGGDPDHHAAACLFDVDLEGNKAQNEGAAILVGAYARLLVDPVSDSECDPASVATLGAVSTAVGTTLVDNSGVDVHSNYTSAATIDIDGAHAQVQAQRLHLEQNGGGYAIRVQNAVGSSITFSQCLLDKNTTQYELVNLQGVATTFDGCTFAANNISGNDVFAFDSGLNLTRSIVNEASTLDVYNPSMATGLIAQYLLLSGPTLPTDGTVLYADPKFVNPTLGDFRLQVASPAMDFAPTGSESGSTDLGGNPREADLPEVSNVFGARDLGAYELSLPDEIFHNGFELSP